MNQLQPAGDCKMAEAPADVLPRKRSDSYGFIPPDMSELRVVLLGSTWKQRSAVANLLLENDAFDLYANCEFSVKIGGPLQKKKISVINTPDMLLADLTADRLAEFLKQIAETSAPGPHVFLLVLQPSEDFTEQHKTRLQIVLQSFCEQAFNHSLMLISTPQVKTPEFMEKYMNDPNIKDMIRKCKYKYLWMNNIENDANLKAFKRKELLTRICQMLENSEEHLNYEQYEEADSQQVYTEQTALAKQKSFLSLPQGVPGRIAFAHFSIPKWNPISQSKKKKVSQASVLRIVLFGKSGDKKTKGSNLIAENQDTYSQNTKHCVAALGKWKGNDVTVVRTPELFKLHFEALIEEMRRCVSLCSPGPNVLLLLVKPSEFNEKDRDTFNFILSLFGPDAFKHAMVVITHDEKKHSCADVLNDCNGRFFNLFEENRQELMEEIESIVQQNKGSYLTITKKTDIEDANIQPSLNLVLCGSRGAEKSSVVQSILSRAAAPSPGQCVKHQGEVCGRWVSLVELPPLSGKPLEAVMQQCLSCISLCGPEGVHAFILVLPVGPLTDQDKAELKTIQDTFSSAVNPFTMILFTVDSDPTTAVVHSDKGVRDVQELSQSCGGGYLIFNTRGQQQVSELLESVETLRAKNKAHSYTTETLVKGQREMISTLHEENIHLKKDGVKKCVDGLSSDCLRIALIGKTGSGKSSSGNTILGRKEFKAMLGQTSVTQICQKEKSTVDGRHVAVVDTPGLYDTNLPQDEVNEEMLKCVSFLAPGPHVFLLVLQVGRFTQEEKETLKLIKKWFGKGAEKFTIILFTHGDQLVNNNMSIQDYIESCDTSFKKLISDCGNRYHVFNNFDENNHTQVKELMEKIDDTVRENGGSYYTNDMLQRAEAAIQKEMERLLQVKDEEMKKLKEEMEIKHQQQMDKQKEEYEKERKQRAIDLKEKEEKLKKEKDKQKRKQEKREENDRKRKEQEEKRRQESEQKTKALEEQIKSEQKSKEMFEMKLQESKRQMEQYRDHWEQEKKILGEKRKEEDEERRQQEEKRQEEMKQIEREKQLKETELKEKEEKIKEEQEQRKREQEKREEEDRKRTEQEDKQRLQWERKHSELLEKIKSEEESKESSEMKLQESRRQMEQKSQQWEKERIERWDKQQAENEERRQKETQIQEEKNRLAAEKEQIERELKEKEKQIKEEQQQRQREEKKREEEDRKRKEQEERQHQEWERKINDLEEKIKSEQKSKETSEVMFQESLRQMAQERERWEEEIRELSKKQEDEKMQWEEQQKALEEQYKQEREEDEKKRREEDQSRQKEEENFQRTIKKMEKEKEEEARAKAELENDFQIKEKEKMEEHQRERNDLVKCIFKNSDNVEKINAMLTKHKEEMSAVTDEQEKEKLQETQQKDLNDLMEEIFRAEAKSRLCIVL